ncbi:hypothetical protein KAS45_07065 [candidate division WOR-3 bacterium]|nr:hypothetical protein [candidate division WOR-3 bacterium]
MTYSRFSIQLLLCVVAVSLLSTGMVHAQLFTKHIIDGDLDWASGVATADMDGDLDIDVVATRGIGQ